MTREQRAREEAEWKRINEEIALESEGIEPLLDSYGVYANETCAQIITPLINIHMLCVWAVHPNSKILRNQIKGFNFLLDFCNNYHTVFFVL